MFIRARAFDSTPPVLVLLALFVFGLMAMLSPSCKCPNGFTYPQCNFTNMVCLTQTMYVKAGIIEPVAHPSNRQERQNQENRLKREVLKNDIVYHANGESISVSSFSMADERRDTVPLKENVLPKDFTEDVSTTKQKALQSNLLLYNAYPVLLFVLAAVMVLPFILWQWAAFENDISCILSTFKFAGSSSADEKSRLTCVERSVNDIKFFLRFFRGKLYKNVQRMYILRILIPLSALLTLIYILDIEAKSIFSFNPCTSITAVYSIGLKAFPSSALCHFNIISRSIARPYTTTCTLPASNLLQLLTPLIMAWLVFLLILGIYRYYKFCKMMSSTSQSKFYKQYGLRSDNAESVSPQNLFGSGGFLLFTTIAKSDNGNILPQILQNLRAPLEANPIDG